MDYPALSLCGSGYFIAFCLGIPFSETGNELVTEVLLKCAFSCFFPFGKSMRINALCIDYQSDVLKFY
jgi:hypothetical protein